MAELSKDQTEALSESQQKFHAFMERIHDGVCFAFEAEAVELKEDDKEEISNFVLNMLAKRGFAK
jgi:hypothetical protein